MSLSGDQKPSAQGTQLALFDDEAPQASKWNRDAGRRALDDLFSTAKKYRSSKAFYELIHFTAKFRFYSPYNSMLIHVQMPGAGYVAPAHRWLDKYSRRIKPDASPIVILQPMGPVMFVFDVSDTDPLPDAPELPLEVTNPFETRSGYIGDEFWKTVESAKRDGVEVLERKAGTQNAGAIAPAVPGRSQHLMIKLKPNPEGVQIPIRYELFLNSAYSIEAKYATLVHELAHLYCGHFGTPNERWWPDRRGMEYEVIEFEAESVCYLLCERLGIKNPSAQYLGAMLEQGKDIPEISLDCVFKSAGLIEQMGRKRLKPRKESNA